MMSLYSLLHQLNLISFVVLVSEKLHCVRFEKKRKEKSIIDFLKNINKYCDLVKKIVRAIRK